MWVTFYTQRRLRRHALFLFAVVGVLLLVACGTTSNATNATQASQPTQSQAVPTQDAPTQAPSARPGKTIEISIIEKNDRYSFSPDNLTIPKGSEVVWINNTDAPHTATSDDSLFKGSSTLMQKQSYHLIFATAGTYKFHCSIHAYMQGTITVTA
ncbi:MAG: hypothetical protein NVS2B12_01110 [Ktedonobacteraceae bacterium]